ncbi:hypothetical protein DZ956_022390 [Pseudomonas aeruginosa]|uniref:hypothetical protein n=1 Tax=Pseudomonas aeruginosa TaxID=287 RepID=UPI000E31E1AA|nr:hypothetical protein [Pseudomonas aeruginosa]NPZ19527.1 hypothetical protein [Pseudomonas aeruginosa]
MTRLYIVLALTVTFALVACGFRLGVNHEQAKAKALDAAQLRQAFEQGQELGTVRERVVTEYVDRVEVVKEVGRTIIKEVPIYVSAEADRACTVNAGFVRLHDAAAAGVLPPDPAGAADARPAGIALSAVAETVAGNYTACHANTEQLNSLLELVRDYQARTGQAPATEKHP